MIQKVFISYARPDQEFVEWLKMQLANDTGLDVRLVPWSDSELGPGNWREELAAQLAASDFLATVMSEHIADADGLRRWMDLELFAAEVLEKSSSPVRPFQSFVIRKDDSPVPSQLKHKNYVDFRERDRGLKKLRRYLLSDARIRLLFFDRTDALRECIRLFAEQGRGHSLIVCNENGAPGLGSSWLLHGLQASLPEQIHPCPTALIFDEQFMQRPKAWLAVLDETANELGIARFGNYRELRSGYVDLSYHASALRHMQMKAPVGARSAQSGARGLELFPQKVSPYEDSQPATPGLTVHDSLEMAWDLTGALLDDLTCAGLPLAWLIDWPRSAIPGSTTHQWLCKLIYYAHQTLEHASPWVIVASSQHPFPELPSIPCCQMIPFKRSEIEEYIKTRLPNHSTDFRRLMAWAVYQYSECGRPSRVHEAYDYVMQGLMND